MTQQVLPPEPSATIEVHADWLEWLCIQSDVGRVSWADYSRTLRMAASDEEVAEHSGYGEDPIDAILDAIASELATRERACDFGAYPFVLESEGLSRRSASDVLPYTFMLGLTLWGKDAGPVNSYPERLFEDLSKAALRRYLGHPVPYVSAEVFGFPRRILPSHFPAAVDALSIALGEGGGNCGEPEAADMKDAALDVVAWRSFPDRDPGQLIVFGQCSTGMDWRDKITHLRPQEWCRSWMLKSPLVTPVGAFFVPRQIEDRHWRVSGIHAGILFDRCRTAWLTAGFDDQSLREAMQSWIDFIVTKGELLAS